MNPSGQPHNLRRITIQSNFKSLITVVPKSIVQIHEQKKIDNVVLPTNPNVNNHVLYTFSPKPCPPEDLTENTVEYIVDNSVEWRDIYHSSDENSEYNPMFFSLRHFIVPEK